MGFVLGYSMGSGNVGAGLAAIADACAAQGGCEMPLWVTIVFWGFIGLLCMAMVGIAAAAIISPSSFSLAPGAYAYTPPPPPPPMPPHRPQWPAGVYRVTALRLGVPTIVYRED